MDFLAFFAGILVGFLGGLLPGLHSNTLVSVLSGLSIDPIFLSIMIVSLYPSHLIASYVPSIFFGIPDRSSATLIMPGQRLVLEGKGLLALKTALFSGSVAGIISLSFFYFSTTFFSEIYPAIKAFVAYFLVFFSIILLLRTKNPLLSMLFFLTSGILCKYSLDLSVTDPFLPLFCGMFSASSILTYEKGVDIPKQKEVEFDRTILPFVFLGAFAGLFSDLLPAIGSSSQIATFISIFIPLNGLEYLATTSALSISQFIFSLSSSAAINKSRIGATAVLSEISNINENFVLYLPLIALAIVVSSAFVYLIRNKIAKLAQTDFSLAGKILLLYLIFLIFVFDGFFGLLVLALSTILGILLIKCGVERINLMGSIIVPTILLLFRIF